ncbi:hypothetical protein HID58_004762, partial [Brassica napus]
HVLDTNGSAPASDAANHHDSNVSSPSFGFDNPHVAYQMRKTTISNVFITFLTMRTSCLSSFYHLNHHKKRKILNPIPLSTIPHKSYVYPRNLDLFSFSPKHHNDKYVLLRRRVFKKRFNPTKFLTIFILRKMMNTMV